MTGTSLAQQARTPERWPTPKVAAHRSSRASLTAKHWSAPALEQAAEISLGILPREYVSAEELPPAAREMWPTPLADDAKNATRKGGQHQSLTRRVRSHPFPTPTVQMIRPDMQRGKRPASGSDDLGTVVERGGDGRRAQGRLNPDWVAWVMGWPIGWEAAEPLDPSAYREWLAQTAAGLWWATEPPIPRLVVQVTARTKRLMSLGNGQVPLCAALAWSWLMRAEVDLSGHLVAPEHDFMDFDGF